MTLRRQTGVTLIELLVTISIAAILMAVAVPGFQDFFRRNRVDNAASDFMAALNYARSEAIRRGNPVVIRNTAGGGNWGAGWVMFEDCNNNNIQNNAVCPDRNGDGNPDNEETIRQGQPVSSSVTVDTNFVAYQNFIRYQPDGRVGNAGVGGGTFVICYGSNRVNSKAIILIGTGRARWGVDNVPAGGNRIPEGENGEDIAATTLCPSPT